MGIVAIDMHIRDDRIFNFIVQQIETSGGEARITHNDIAEIHKCHRLTARNIVNRLVAAGRISVVRSRNSEGCLYRLPEERAKAS